MSLPHCKSLPRRLSYDEVAYETDLTNPSWSWPGGITLSHDAYASTRRCGVGGLRANDSILARRAQSPAFQSGDYFQKWQHAIAVGAQVYFISIQTGCGADRVVQELDEWKMLILIVLLLIFNA